MKLAKLVFLYYEEFVKTHIMSIRFPLSEAQQEVFHVGTDLIVNFPIHYPQLLQRSEAATTH